MRKGKALRLAGFVGAACASVALVATAVETTGAYFTGTQNGAISGNAGHLNLDITGGSTWMNFANVMPGDRTPQNVNYKIDVSQGNVDLWLVFDPTQAGYQLFTGGNNSPGSIVKDSNGNVINNGGLGRYGWFSVRDTSSTTPAFQSGNLKFPDYVANAGQDQTPYSNQTSPLCTVNSNGDGGSSWIANSTNKGDTSDVGYCGVPDQILLRSNLQNGWTGSVEIAYGLNGYMQTQQYQPMPTVPFKLVATQHGVPPLNSSYAH